ncbi:HD domain-containing protein [bacterium]|nr:HD domain-containing protein [bacterium]
MQDKEALNIVKKLRSKGFTAYYAGGCVRDMIMGIPSEDIDIATNAIPDEVIKLFKRTIPVGLQFGVVIVMAGEKKYEVATFRTDLDYKDGRHPEGVTFSSQEEDAKRRDFTINGMFYDPIEEKIIDFVSGQEDIKKQIIRAIDDPDRRFEEDKLRMLRAVRFSARFNFKIEDNTFNAIKRHAHKINEVSAERVRDELVKMFTNKNRSLALQLLNDTELLKQILPEVYAMKGVEQPPEFHPEGDVFKHTKLTLDYLPANPSSVLAMAALLHDIGKPPCFKITDRIRFHGHDAVGTKIADKILKRLKFSNEDRKKICLYIAEHMRFMHVQDMRIGKLKKMLARESIYEELDLHEADCMASHGMIDNKIFCIQKLEEFGEEEIRPQPLITGYDLIDLGFKPSKLFSDILEDVENMQLEGELKTKKQAVKYVKKKYIK